MKVVAAHQPNLLPWLPFWAKLKACQEFIVLDDVQYPKQCWVNRVRLDLPSGLAWLSLPVHHSSQDRIDQVQLDDSRPWRRKLLAGLRQAYGRHPFFAEVFPGLQECLNRPGCDLLQLNLDLLHWVMGLLQLQRPLHFSSRLNSSAQGSERLVQLCQRVGASHYLAGSGAAAYEDLELYRRASLEYRSLSFPAPRYQGPRGEERPAGMSVLDALMCRGPRATSELLP